MVWANPLDRCTAFTRTGATRRAPAGRLDEVRSSAGTHSGNRENSNCGYGEQGSSCQKSRLYSWLLDMADWKGERMQELYNYGDLGSGLYGPDLQRTYLASYTSADCPTSDYDRLAPMGCNGVGIGGSLIHCEPSPFGQPGLKRCTLSDFDLKDMADVVIVKNLPYEIIVEKVGGYERFVRDHLLGELDIDNPHVTVIQGKLRDMVYLFDMPEDAIARLCSHVKTSYPGIRCEPRMIVRLTPQHERQVTAIMNKLLDQERRHQVTYKDLFEKLYHIPLIRDLPFDKTCLEEVDRDDFFGIQRNFSEDPSTAKLLSSTHLVVVISLRKLAPVIHEMLSGPVAIYPSPPSSPDRKHYDGVLVDRAFLAQLQNKLEREYGHETLSEVASGTEETNYSSGEGQPKALEYLITCVPGIEVYYSNGNKYIRKMDLNDRNNISLDTESMGSPVSPKAGQTGNSGSSSSNSDDPVKKLVQTITAILKVAKNQYMTLSELGQELRRATDLPSDFVVRDFITEHVKFHQLLTLGEPELVMLSHRAQIKRISNDLQKVLRRLTPRFVNTATLPPAFMDLWENCDNAASRPNGDRSATFNVSRYGVCFLDDIMVTIPQNWGIHCSVYISNSDGRLIVRTRGDGEENVPTFVKLSERLSMDCSDNPMTGFGDSGFDGNLTNAHRRDSHVRFTTVYAWAPRSRISDNQQRNLAIFRQQLLNMYRGDPTAARVKEINENWEPRYGNENERLKRLDTACLRANVEQPPRMKRPGDKAKPESDAEHRHHVPCDLKLHFNQFIPTFHHVYNAQATVSRYGVKTLFEAFELMNDTINLSHAEAQAAMIQLTPEAKREVMERRLIYLMRNSNGTVDYNRLLNMYMSQPTMSAYGDTADIEEAVRRCNLFNIRLIPGGNCYISVKPRFSFSLAVGHYGKDIANLVTIFMRSFTWLTFGELNGLFREKHNRALPAAAFRQLLDLGAIRYPMCSSTSAEGTVFDLQDDCRIVRNLIHQMNNKPDATYVVYDPRNDTNRIVYGARDERSITFLLECSGDCMYADFDVDAMIKDFSEYFVPVPNADRRVRGAYKLHSCVIVGAPDGDDQEQPQAVYRRAFRPRALSFTSGNSSASLRANNNGSPSSSNTSIVGRQSNRQHGGTRHR